MLEHEAKGDPRQVLPRCRPTAALGGGGRGGASLWASAESGGCGPWRCQLSEGRGTMRRPKDSAVQGRGPTGTIQSSAAPQQRDFPGAVPRSPAHTATPHFQYLVPSLRLPYQLHSASDPPG